MLGGEIMGDFNGGYYIYVFVLIYMLFGVFFPVSFCF